MYGEFIKNIISKIWNFLFEINFTIDGHTVYFGALFCYSLLFIIGLRVIAVLVNSYDHDD
jgi:hypothetical protein